MAKILTIDEMLECLNMASSPHFEQAERLIEQAAIEVAHMVAEEFNIEVGEQGATSEGLAFAGTCAAFYARHEDQRMPEFLRHFDTGGDWETRDGKRPAIKEYEDK